MLPKRNRLLKNLDFDLVKKAGVNISGSFFSLRVLRKDGDSPCRFGFVVSTRYSKKAVERNRAKRILREAVRKNMKIIKGSYDFVFFVKGSMKKVGLGEIENEITKVFGEVS